MQRGTQRRDPWPAVGIGCTIAFLVVAVLVARRGGLPFDEPITAWLHGLPLPIGFWEACTSLGGAFLILVGAAFVVAALLAGRPRLAVIVAVTLIASALFTDLVKDYIARPRPPGVGVVPETGYSFPSGHTLNSTATYGLLAFVAWRSRLPQAIRVAAVIVGVTVPILVGLSRIALGVHYPSDVLGGWLAGIAFVAFGAVLIQVTDALGPPLDHAASPATGAVGNARDRDTTGVAEDRHEPARPGERVFDTERTVYGKGRGLLAVRAGERPAGLPAGVRRRHHRPCDGWRGEDDVMLRPVVQRRGDDYPDREQ